MEATSRAVEVAAIMLLDGRFEQRYPEFQVNEYASMSLAQIAHDRLDALAKGTITLKPNEKIFPAPFRKSTLLPCDARPAAPA